MIFKFCPKCNRKINYKSRYCDECESVYKEEKRINDKTAKERYKRYRDKRTDAMEQAFYNSPPWQYTRDSIKIRDKNICQYCFYVDEYFNVADLVHHIEELKENWDRRLDEHNLICVCSRCHREIHYKYLESYESKKEMQKILFNIVEKKYLEE